MCQRDNRFLLATARRHAAVEASQAALALLDRRPGGLHKCASKVAVPIADARTLAFPGALVLTWCQSGPTAHVCLAWEAVHICPQFGHDHRRDTFTNPRYRIHNHRCCPRAFWRARCLTPAVLLVWFASTVWRRWAWSCVLNRLVDPGIKGRNLFVKHINQCQMLCEHKGVVWLQTPTQRLLQLGLLGSQATLGQLSTGCDAR